MLMTATQYEEDKQFSNEITIHQQNNDVLKVRCLYLL